MRLIPKWNNIYKRDDKCHIKTENKVIIVFTNRNLYIFVE